MMESDESFYSNSNNPNNFINKKDWEYLKEQLNFQKIKEEIKMNLLGWTKNGKNEYIKINGIKPLLPQQAIYKIMSVLDKTLNINTALSNFDPNIIVNLSALCARDIQEFLTYSYEYRIDNVQEMALIVNPIFHTVYSCLRRALSGNTFDGLTQNMEVQYKKISNMGESK